MALKRILIVSAVIAAVGFALWWIRGGKGEPSPMDDPGFFHTAEGTQYRIEELRTALKEALDRSDYRFIHDNMYYFEGLVEAYARRLPQENLADLGERLAEMKQTSTAIDNASARGDPRETTEHLNRLFGLIDGLEPGPTNDIPVPKP
jgi:hypothetical protein